MKFSLVFFSICVLIFLSNYERNPKPEICKIFVNDKIIVDEKDNFCVHQPENNLYVPVPCSVVRTCYPEKFGGKDVSR